MWDYLLRSSVALLAFLPGASLLLAFRTIRSLKIFDFTRRLRVSELILAGMMLWNFFLIIPSLYLGLSSFYMPLYFVLFLYASVMVFIVSATVITIQLTIKLPASGSSRFKPSGAISITYVFLIGMFLVIAIMVLYTPIIWNWDGIAVYIPIAKGIVTSGNLISNPLSELATAFPPTVLLMYAWIIAVNGLFFRFIPITYLFLAVLATYNLSFLEFKDKKKSLIASVLFLSIPGIQVLTSTDGLSLDIALIAYMAISVYFIVSAMNKKKAFELVVGGATASLMALTKGVGTALLPILFIFVLIGEEYKHHRITKMMLLVSNIAILTFVGAMRYHAISPYIVYVIAFLMIFVFLITSFDHIGNFKFILYFLLTAITPLVFYIRNIVVSGLITIEFRILGMSVEQQNPLLKQIFWNTGTPTLFPMPIGLLASGLGSAQIIAPALIGALVFAKKVKTRKEITSLLLLAWFFALLIIWIVYFGGSFELWEYRRIMYFAVPLSIFATEGFMTLAKYMKVSLRYLTSSLLSFVGLSLLYIWVFTISEGRTNKAILVPTLSAMRLIDILIYLFFLGAPLVLFSVLSKRESTYGRAKQETKASFSFSSLSLKGGMGLGLLSIICIFSLTALQINNWNMDYYDSITSVQDQIPTIAYAYGDVIDYLKQNKIEDSYIFTIGTGFIPLIADTKYIEVTNIWQYEYLNPLLQLNDTRQLVDVLGMEGIKYFLIPKSNHPLGYYESTYMPLAEKFLLLKFIGDPKFFETAEDFYAYTLFRLKRS